MKIEWLVTDAPAVGSPDRADCALLEAILAGRYFGQFIGRFCDQGGARFGVGTPS